MIAEQCLFFASISLTKASLIATYLRVFRGDYFVRLRRICYAVLPCLFGSLLYAVFGVVFLCSPVEKLWKPTTPGSCRSSLVYYVISAGINIALDLVVWLLPVVELQQLKLPRRQVLGILFVFILGAL